MEESIMGFDLFKNKFSIMQAKQLNPLVLAFIGDSVYEVFIRLDFINENRDMSVHKLHVKVVSFVKAHAQSEIMKKIEENLNDEEMAIFKRGRNAKSGVPKNADVQEYRMATGFEAVIGYLYITEQTTRLNQILNGIISGRDINHAES
jgi:ribonuclease-3 family protein